jgi:LL-diaminopimelate aminotransferase
MAGARVGFCLGNREIVAAVRRLKSNLDYGMFLPIQKAAIAAVTGDQSCVEQIREAYRCRRDLLCDGLSAIGWNVRRSPATMFVWAAVPEGFSSSAAFAMELVERSGVMVTPGSAFGPRGEGFVRLALVQSEEVLRRAVDALRESGVFQR